MLELPRDLTIGEAYGPAMEIADQSKADEYFEALVVRYMKYFGEPREIAERTQRHNLGYYAGYYDSETRARVERLFRCAHPIFGAVAQTGQPTPEEALQEGRNAAQGITNA